jgi:hypothetical protein
MGLLRITYDEPDRKGTYGIEVEGGVMTGSLWYHDGRWHWDLYDGTDRAAFADGEAITKSEAQADVQTAAIDRVAGTLF